MHPRIRQSCGFASENVPKWRPGFADDLDLPADSYGRLHNTKNFFDPSRKQQHPASVLCDPIGCNRHSPLCE